MREKHDIEEERMEGSRSPPDYDLRYMFVKAQVCYVHVASVQRTSNDRDTE